MIRLIFGIIVLAYIHQGWGEDTKDSDYIDKHISGFINYSVVGKGVDTDFENLQSLSLRFRWQDTFDDILKIHVEFYANTTRARYSNALSIDYSDPYYTSYKLRGEIDSTTAYWACSGKTTYCAKYNDEYNSYFRKFFPERYSDPYQYYNDDNYHVRVFNTSHSYFRFDETYLELGDEVASLKIGNQKIVWGQNSLVSPLNFLLPFSQTEFSVKANVSDYLYPNQLALLTIVADPTLELEFYYFFNHDRDPVGDYFGRIQALQTSHVFKKINALCQGEATWGRSECEFTNDYGDVKYRPNKSSQQAFRLLYHDEVIFALTYFNGYFGQVPTREGMEMRLVQALPALPAHVPLCPSQSDCYYNRENINPNLNTPLYNIEVDYHNGFAQVEAIGLELSVVTEPHYTFQIDYLKFLNPIPFYDFDLVSGYDDTYEINPPPCALLLLAVQHYSSSSYLGCNRPRTNSDRIDDKEYLQALIKNGGKLYSEVYYEFLSLGFSNEDDDGFFANFYFYLYKFKNKKYPSDVKAYYPSINEITIIPTFLLGQRFGIENKEQASFIFGTFSSCRKCYGIATNYSSKVYENIEINFYLAFPFTKIPFSFNTIYLPDYKKLVHQAIKIGFLQEPMGLPAANFDNGDLSDYNKGNANVYTGFGVSYYF
ncbi:MAG: DUF1302 family protein [Methylacidiphilales bacterium]|nr:DUF1302 family protein [Candidatus Methylacidiphilales bacterium]